MHTITRADILDMSAYEAVRAEKRAEVLAVKRNRRVAVGPHATAYFENRLTVWWQIHEMLRIEQGGEAQIEDELTAYSSLIPNGDELICTLMFEIDDENRRCTVLAGLGGVEERVFFRIGEHKVAGVAEEDIDRTTADGKASSVQFIHFPFSAEAKQGFASADVIFGVDHPNYSHMTQLGPDVKQALALDFV